MRYPMLRNAKKNSPKSKFWCQISRRRPRGYPGGRPGAKASVRSSKSWEKQAFFGADIHDPKAQTSMTPGGFWKLRSENFGLNFCSLHAQRTQPYQKHYGIANYCAVVFWLRPPYLLRCEPSSERRAACKTNENDVRARVRDSKICDAIVATPHLTRYFLIPASAYGDTPTTDLVHCLETWLSASSCRHDAAARLVALQCINATKC